MRVPSSYVYRSFIFISLAHFFGPSCHRQRSVYIKSEQREEVGCLRHSQPRVAFKKQKRTDFLIEFIHKLSKLSGHKIEQIYLQYLCHCASRSRSLTGATEVNKYL